MGSTAFVAASGFVPTRIFLRLTRARSHVLRLTAAASAITLTLTNCVSYTYIDDRNVKHVVGFVDVTAGAAQAGPGEQSDSLTVTTVGVAVSAMPDHRSVSLGYSRETLLSIANNACIGTPPVAEIQPEISRGTP